MDKTCGVHLFMVISTDEDFLSLSADWLNWKGVARELDIGRSRAHQIMAAFAPEDCALISVQLPGYDSRPCKYIRRAAFDNLMRRKKGNPKWHDTKFQQEMARRRWERGREAASRPSDEVRVIRI